MTQFPALTFGVALLATVCLSIAPVRAQAPAAPDTVIRSESRLVLVDAVAIDKKGKFPRDLAAKDFRVWEDGKEQKITSFSLENSGLTQDRPNKHYIVLFFDTTTGGELRVRQQATQFVDGFASPDRYFSVLSYNYDVGLRVAQNFTADPALVKKAIGAIQPATGRPATLRDFLEAVRNVAKSLSAIRGRKAMVMFSAGSAIDASVHEDVDQTILALNKANIAVYSAGGGGLAAASAAAAGGRGGGRGGRAVAEIGNDLAVGMLGLGGTLADATGGVAFINTNDLAGDLGKVAQEQDQYYLLGYTPTIESPEGSCHNLTVKVDRSDLEVRARKGYCTAKPVDTLTGKPLGADLEARAASAAAGNMKAGMQLPWFYAAPNIARVNLAMDIDTSGIKFAKEKGKLHAALNLAGVAYKADGSIAARVSDTVNFDFALQPQVDEFLATPYHYENQFELAPGQYNFRMAFSSDATAAHSFGKAELPLAIDPWDGKTLSASGIALSHDVHKAADLTSGLDNALLEGLRPLVSRGNEVVPAGINQFHAADSAAFYIEAYEPLLAALPPQSTDPLPLVGLRIRVLDRANGQQKEDTGVKSMNGFLRAGNPVIPIAANLPIANLTPGKYKLEVSVMRQTGDPVIRTADFEVR